MKVLSMNSIHGLIIELHNIYQEKDCMDYGIGLILKVGIHLEDLLEEQFIQD